MEKDERRKGQERKRLEDGVEETEESDEREAGRRKRGGKGEVVEELERK